MKRELLGFLSCPECGSNVRLEDDDARSGEVEWGTLVCLNNGRKFPIARFVPRFAVSENYASSFGFQWQEFRLTQRDSYTGIPISRTRFFEQSA